MCTESRAYAGCGPVLLGWGGYEINRTSESPECCGTNSWLPLCRTFPASLANLNPTGRWVDPLLRQAYAEARKAGNSQKQLNAALALLPVDDAVALSEGPVAPCRCSGYRGDSPVASRSQGLPRGRMLAGARSRHGKIRVKHSRRQVPWHSTILRILSGRRFVSTWRVGLLPRIPTWSPDGLMPFVLLPSNLRSVDCCLP